MPLHIYLLGATGRVGKVILQNALDDGHQVSVLVRSPEKIKIKSPLLTVYQGNVLNKIDLINSMKQCDVVISALNTDKKDTLSKSMPLIIDAMSHYDLSRIITIGTAGILNSRSEPNLYRFQSNESKRRSTTAAEDHLSAYHILKSSNLNWTIVCPTYLPDSEVTGKYRTEINVLPENAQSISVGDTANFAYSLLFTNTFLKTRIGIAH